MITITGKFKIFDYSGGLINICPQAQIIYKFSSDGYGCLILKNKFYAFKFNPTDSNPPAFLSTSAIGTP